MAEMGPKWSILCPKTGQVHCFLACQANTSEHSRPAGPVLSGSMGSQRVAKLHLVKNLTGAGKTNIPVRTNIPPQIPLVKLLDWYRPFTKIWGKTIECTVYHEYVRIYLYTVCSISATTKTLKACWMDFLISSVLSQITNRSSHTQPGTVRVFMVIYRASIMKFWGHII